MSALWTVLPWWSAALSLLAFGLMGLDKRRARRGGWRIRERTFFLLALLGGSPGAIAGMWAFRHKTRHWYFKYGPAPDPAGAGASGLLPPVRIAGAMPKRTGGPL